MLYLFHQAAAFMWLSVIAARMLANILYIELGTSCAELRNGRNVQSENFFKIACFLE